jgi:hypothetical protein
MKRGVALAAAVVVAVALGASTALAGPDQDRAESLFKAGKSLLAKQKYQEACSAFAESNQLDPAIGTMLNLALCYEGWGKVARAQAAYLEAEKMAAIKGDRTRAAAARQRADALTPKIPKIVFTGLVEPLPADLVVSLDGDAIGFDAVKAGVSTDPGAHTVMYTAEGVTQTVQVELEQSQTKEVTLELPQPVDPGDGTGDGTGTGDGNGDGDGNDGTGSGDGGEGSGRGRGRRIGGIVTLSAGVVAMGVGGVVALMARSDYNTAFDAHCDAANTCDDEGYDLTHDARRRANIASIVVGAGAAIAVTGLVVWLTAPSGAAKRDQVWIRPVVTGDGGGIAIGGAL